MRLPSDQMSVEVVVVDLVVAVVEVEEVDLVAAVVEGHRTTMEWASEAVRRRISREYSCYVMILTQKCINELFKMTHSYNFKCG